MIEHRLDFLEKKVTVMQDEVSTVLGEMQSTIQAIAATYSTALKVAMQRIDELERKVNNSVAGASIDNVLDVPTGKEL